MGVVMMKQPSEQASRQRELEPTAWRCSWCGRVEGADMGHGYTDGICIDCLWKYYPDRAARIIEAVHEAGGTLHVLPSQI